MRQNRLKTGMITAIFFFFGITISQAQSNRQKPQKPPTFSELLKKMDANEDGKLSKKEIKGPLKDDFSKVDTNEDGFISKKEFQKAPKPKRRN